MKKLILAPAALLASVAYAAVDPAVLTAVATAQADGLIVAGVMTTMVAVIWGAMFIKRKFFG